MTNGEALAVEDRADRLDLLAACRPDDGEDVVVGRELLADGRRLRRVELGVALDEREAVPFSSLKRSTANFAKFNCSVPIEPRRR